MTPSGQCALLLLTLLSTGISALAEALSNDLVSVTSITCRVRLDIPLESLP